MSMEERQIAAMEGLAEELRRFSMMLENPIEGSTVTGFDIMRQLTATMAEMQLALRQHASAMHEYAEVVRQNTMGMREHISALRQHTTALYDHREAMQRHGNMLSYRR